MTSDSNKKRKLTRLSSSNVVQLVQFLSPPEIQEDVKDKTLEEILAIVKQKFPTMTLGSYSLRKLLRAAGVTYRQKMTRQSPVAIRERVSSLASFMIDCIVKLDAGVPIDESALEQWHKYARRKYLPRDIRLKKLQNPQLNLPNMGLTELPDDEDEISS